MHRLPRIDLEAIVFVAIATAPLAIKRGLKSKLLTDRDKARQALTRSICEKLDNDSYMVIVTEMILRSSPWPHLGKWGIDEPVPATVTQAPAPPEAVNE